MSRLNVEIRVECHAGYRGEETPRRLHLEEITEVLARRTEPDARLFRVGGDDGRTYRLRLDDRKKRWEIPEVAG